MSARIFREAALRWKCRSWHLPQLPTRPTRRQSRNLWLRQKASLHSLRKITGSATRETVVSKLPIDIQNPATLGESLQYATISLQVQHLLRSKHIFTRACTKKWKKCAHVRPYSRQARKQTNDAAGCYSASTLAGGRPRAQHCIDNVGPRKQKWVEMGRNGYVGCFLNRTY